jgi:predicted nucleic acid-binding protein
LWRSSSRPAVRKRLPVAEMIVLDANILIRAVLGKRVRQLLETYTTRRIRFYAPEIAYADAAKYLPALLIKRGKSETDVPAALAYLQSLIEPISREATVCSRPTPGSVSEVETRMTDRCWQRRYLCPVRSGQRHRLFRNRRCGLDLRSGRNPPERAVRT